jgi:hypothetical protein
MSAIDTKYEELGGIDGFLGKPIIEEQTCPDSVGHYRHFQNGSIYWHPETGAFEVHGGIRWKWSSLGWEKSVLGYPTTDEKSTPDGKGRYNHFQHGSIYWHPDTGAFEVHGGIRARWAGLGWEKSYLGYPISDELTTGGNARYSRFQGGAIYWTPEQDAQDMIVKRPTPAYLISLDKFHIDNTRAWDDDTDVVNFALKVGNAKEDTKLRAMGDVDNGDHYINLYFGPIHITDPNTPIVFSYQIVNSGHGDWETVKKAMDTVANKLSTSLAATGDIWGKIGAGAIQAVNWLAKMLVANCDGPVAIDKIAGTGDSFGKWTMGAGIRIQTRYYPGLDSDWGCGSNSRYYVTWTLIEL